MLKTRRSPWRLALVLVCAMVTCPREANADCVAETAATGIDAGLVIHLSPSCTQAERESHAVRGEVIMDAIAKGRSVDLLGVLVRGDLIFDRLAVQTTAGSPGSTSERATLGDHVGGNGQRIVRQALSLGDCVVLGTVRHRAADSTLRFEGHDDFSGSHF